MKHRMFILTVGSLLFALSANGQTDIGSAASNGAITVSQPLAGRRNATAEQQKQLLSVQCQKVQAYASKNNSPSLSDSDCESFVRAYGDLLIRGHDIYPFEFLSRAIAIRELPPGQLPDKKAELIQAELTPAPVHAAVVASSAAAKSISRQYKESLSKTEKELKAALK